MSQLCYLHQLREMRVHLKFEEWNKRGYITQGALRGVMGSLANQANVQNASMFSASSHAQNVYQSLAPRQMT